MRALTLLAFALLPGTSFASIGAKDTPDEFDQFALHCEFEGLPDVQVYYSSQGHRRTGAMVVGGRGPAIMSLGQGSEPAETAAIDGYEFIFWPRGPYMDVGRIETGESVAGASGGCVQISFGSPEPISLD